MLKRPAVGKARGCWWGGWVSWWGRMLLLSVALLLVACQGSGGTGFNLPPTPTAVPTARLRLFWVDSYSAGDPWSAQIRLGLVETLARQGYAEPQGNFELGEFHLEMREQLTLTEVETRMGKAMAAVDAFAPDVLVVSDDEAAKILVPHYARAGFPVVFCGVNGELAPTALAEANVTGVLELPRVEQTLRIAQSFMPAARRFLFLGDASPSGLNVLVSVLEQLKLDNPLGEEAPQLAVTSDWTFWQRAVLSETTGVDFILLGRYDQLYRPDGSQLSPVEVMRWTWAQSPVPVFALWDSAVQEGAVGGLTITGYEQGAEAARLVVQILGGQSPATLTPRSPTRNLLAVNLASARHWQLPIPVQFPLTAQTYRNQPAPLEGGH